MATSTLQIRIDSDLRREADALFASTGLDLTSAVRLFLRQSVIRRRLPFEVVSENPDPFWSEANQRVLRESIDSLERGEGQRHELIGINLLVKDIERNGNTGIGKPEPLRNMNGYWSRRINDEHRLVYKLSGTSDPANGDSRELFIAQCATHYE